MGYNYYMEYKIDNLSFDRNNNGHRNVSYNKLSNQYISISDTNTSEINR